MDHCQMIYVWEDGRVLCTLCYRGSILANLYSESSETTDYYQKLPLICYLCLWYMPRVIICVQSCLSPWPCMRVLQTMLLKVVNETGIWTVKDVLINWELIKTVTVKRFKPLRFQDDRFAERKPGSRGSARCFDFLDPCFQEQQSASIHVTDEIMCLYVCMKVTI